MLKTKWNNETRESCFPAKFLFFFELVTYDNLQLYSQCATCMSSISTFCVNLNDELRLTLHH